MSVVNDYSSGRFVRTPALNTGTITGTDIDLSTGNYFEYTMTGDTTFTFSNPLLNNTSTAFLLKLTGVSGASVTYPSEVEWSQRIVPEAPGDGETDVLLFFTNDNGLTYYGSRIANNIPNNEMTPGVVTNGLLLHLDAAINSSYPGEGNDWLDLSGNDNDGTLINGPLYSPDNGGSIVFDGANDHVKTTSVMFDPNSDFTFSCWVNPDTLSAASGQTKTIVAEPYRTNAIQIRFRGTAVQIVDSYVIGVGEFTNFTASVSTWYNVVVVRSGNTYSLYVNGEFKSSFSSSNVYTYGPTGIGINNNSEEFDGKIAVIQTYQRVLSDSEILQNFNAIRSRYGL